VGKDPTAYGASCEPRSTSWRTSAQASSQAMYRHDAAPGRQSGCLAWGGQPELDLIVTMDDATSEVYSVFLVEEEGTASTFRGLLEVFTQHGLPSSLYTDRGSHHFLTANVGEPVDKERLTQVGRALAQVGIEHLFAGRRAVAANALLGCCRVDYRKSCGYSASPISHSPAGERVCEGARSGCSRRCSLGYSSIGSSRAPASRGRPPEALTARRSRAAPARGRGLQARRALSSCRRTGTRIKN